jgi:alkylation response protein AidB-like acyl-CoA dehydrogenase
MGTEMLETADFFENQIKECHAQAARATNKADREFWRRLADRWTQVLQAKKSYGGPDIVTVRPARPIMRFSKRRAA